MAWLAALSIALSLQTPSIGRIVSVGKWTAVNRPDACAITAVYAGIPQKQLFFMVKEQRPDLLIMSISSTAWSIRNDAEYDVAVDFDGKAFDVEATGYRTEDGGSLMTSFSLPTLDLVAAARTVDISAQGMQLGRLSLDGSGAAVRHMRLCVARMPAVVSANAKERAAAERVSADPFSVIAPKAAPKIAGPTDWITSDDYPASALNDRATGTVGYRFTVNEAGRVQGCQVVRSSGNAALDRATCAALTRRGQYSPGASHVVQGEHAWRLPPE